MSLRPPAVASAAPTQPPREPGDALYRQLFEQAHDALVLHDLQGRILDANRRAIELFGYSRAELRRLRIIDLNTAPARPSSRAAAAQIRAQGSVRLELDLLKKSGEVFPAEIVAVLVDDGTASWVHGRVRDLSEHRRQQEQLRRAQRHDPLTGLLNRQCFRERLDAAIGRVRRRSGDGAALLIIELDRFKTINEGLGHPLGDRLLIEVAERLRGCVGDGDQLARLGGDELGILLEGMASVVDARELAERVEQALARVFELEGHRIFTSASIGIALADPGYRGADDWLRDADNAVYRAKALGGGRQVVFEPPMHQSALERLELANGLRQAAARGELRLHFQPIVELRTGALRELEALVRWQHPTRGLLAPGAFLPVAEEIGDLPAIDAWVLETACRELALWRRRFGARAPRGVAMNVSGRQFSRHELVDQVEAALAGHGLGPERLRLEVTEGALLAETGATAAVLGRLRRLGVAVVLDDFGTGYSSLSYLHRFRFDALKIDRSFVSGESAGSQILGAIVGLAHSLDLEVIAEGVERPEQLARLRELGCQAGQGFLFAPPLPADAVAGWIEDRTPG